MTDSLSVFFFVIPVTIGGAAALWARSTRAAESNARARDRLWARLCLGLAAIEALMGLSVAMGVRLH
jgi:hypothetical protein